MQLTDGARQRRLLVFVRGWLVRLTAGVFFFCAVAFLPLSSARAQGGRKVIRLEAIKVEGRIQKPQAFYILQRSNLNFEGLKLQKSFIPKIIQSVEEQPF